jgi:hypothetical protein
MMESIAASGNFKGSFVVSISKARTTGSARTAFSRSLLREQDPFKFTVT